MGLTQSTETEGMQVTRVLAGSPAHEAGMVPYFDFVVGLDGAVLASEDPCYFREYVTKSQGQPVRFVVLSLYSRCIRQVSITPSVWGGDGGGLLGMELQWRAAARAALCPWRVLAAPEGSPLAIAGVRPLSSYIVGISREGDPSAPCVFATPDSLHATLAAHSPSGSACATLLVFDAVRLTVSEVPVSLLYPDSSPGGSLGCDVASGYVHAVPDVPNSPRLPSFVPLALGGGPARAPAAAPAAADGEEVLLHVAFAPAAPSPQHLAPAAAAAPSADLSLVAAPAPAAYPPPHPAEYPPADVAVAAAVASADVAAAAFLGAGGVACGAGGAAPVAPPVFVVPLPVFAQ